MIRRFFLDDKGATAVEYAMIAAFIVLAFVLALPALGADVRGMFDKVVGAFAH